MTSYFDCSDAEGQDLGDSDVECIHGRDLFARCDECAAIKAASPWDDDEVTAVDDSDACAYFDAADGGEGDDMQDIDKMMGPKHSGHEIDPAEVWETTLAMLLDTSSDLQLKQARYALDREEKKRIEQAQATIRALDPNAPKPRARRSDAGKPRAAKEHAA